MCSFKIFLNYNMNYQCFTLVFEEQSWNLWKDFFFKLGNWNNCGD